MDGPHTQLWQALADAQKLRRELDNTKRELRRQRDRVEYWRLRAADWRQRARQRGIA